MLFPLVVLVTRSVAAAGEISEMTIEGKEKTGEKKRKFAGTTKRGWGQCFLQVCFTLDASWVVSLWRLRRGPRQLDEQQSARRVKCGTDLTLGV